MNKEEWERQHWRQTAAWLAQQLHQMGCRIRVTAVNDIDQALEHLGNVLYFVADVHPDDRCEALNNALEFYNSARPTKKVAPSETGYQRIVDQTEIDRMRNEIDLWHHSRPT